MDMRAEMTPGGAFATIASGELAAMVFIISKIFLVGSLGAGHAAFDTAGVGGGSLALTPDGRGISIIPSCFIGGVGDARGGTLPDAYTVVVVVAVAVNVAAVAMRCERWISVSRAYFFRLLPEEELLAGQLLESLLRSPTAIVACCCGASSGTKRQHRDGKWLCEVTRCRKWSRSAHGRNKND